MNNQLIIIITINFLLCQAVRGIPDSSQKDESMVRARRLFNATFLEVSASEVGQWQQDLETVGPQDIGAFKKLLEEEPGDNFTQNTVLSFVCKIDGCNMCSTGDKDVLEITREFLADKSNTVDWLSVEYSLLYLSQKGDSRDLFLLEKYSKLPSKLPIIKKESVDCLRILQARVSGTNVLEGLETRYYNWSTNSPPFLPSVANTGPQAAYVYDLLKQALKKYGSPENILPEILTLVVTLDADGKPSCSIDLAKYGLAMPALSVRQGKSSAAPKQAGEGGMAAADQPAPPCTEAQEEMDEMVLPSSPVSRFWPFLVGGVVFAALILFRIHRR